MRRHDVRRQELLETIRVHRLDLEQFLCQCIHRGTLPLDNLPRRFVAAHHQRPNLVVHAARGFLAEASGTRI